MYAVIGVFVCVVLLSIAVKYQRHVKVICRQLTFIQKYDSNMLVSGKTGIKGMDRLVEIVNAFLEIRKRVRKDYLEKE